jgi:hypothetical protein
MAERTRVATDANVTAPSLRGQGVVVFVVGIAQDDQGPEEDERRNKENRIPIKGADGDELCFVKFYPIAAASIRMHTLFWRRPFALMRHSKSNISTMPPQPAHMSKPMPVDLTLLGIRPSTRSFTTMLFVARPRMEIQRQPTSALSTCNRVSGFVIASAEITVHSRKCKRICEGLQV